MVFLKFFQDERLGRVSSHERRDRKHGPPKAQTKKRTERCIYDLPQSPSVRISLKPVQGGGHPAACWSVCR